jgi:hypothetical protein
MILDHILICHFFAVIMFKVFFQKKNIFSFNYGKIYKTMILSLPSFSFHHSGASICVTGKTWKTWKVTTGPSPQAILWTAETDGTLPGKR